MDQYDYREEKSFFLNNILKKCQQTFLPFLNQI